MSTFLQLAASGIMVGAIYALIAVGIVLIVKATGIFNFAQGSFFALGGFFCYQLGVGFGIPIWISVLATMVFATGFGFFLERFALRPLVGQSLFAAVMLTLALGYAIDGAVLTVWGGEPSPFSIFPATPVTLGKVFIFQEYVWTFVISLLVFGALVVVFKFTKTGLLMRAVAEGHQIAQSLGVNVHRVFGQTWAISAMVASLGGILIGALYGIDATMSTVALKAFPVVLLGGLESLAGAMIAGPIIGLAEMLTSYYVDPYVGGGTLEVTPFIVMMIIIMIRPFGLFGLKRIERI